MKIHLTTFISFFLGFFLLFGFNSCKKAEAEEKYTGIPDAEMTKEEMIKKGEYLVNSIGCHDCHSPKKMGEYGPEIIKELSYSGYQKDQPLPEVSKDALEKGWMLMNADLTAFVGPWGISFAANLTSDDTGIGTWSFEQFKRALTEGKFKGLENSRPLLPPMPWQNYKDMKEEDLRAMYEYFMSTEPVENAVPAPLSPDRAISVAD